MSLLDDLAVRPRWQTRAACRGMDPADFVPKRGEAPVMVAAARAVCAECPVTAECLDYALSLPPNKAHGIWGGTTERERRALRRHLRVTASTSAA